MKQKLQTLLITICVIGITQNVQAQKESTTIKDSIVKKESTKNLIKVNLTAIAIRNFSFQYERAIGKKTSAVMGLKFMAKGQLPLINQIKNNVDTASFNHIEKLSVSSISFTPEVRFYFGQDVFRGFYVAPFARISNFKADLPVEYSYEHPIEGPKTGTISLNGSLNSITGGLMLGAQWKLTRMLYLDWWILGPHFGSSNGNIIGTSNKALSEDEQNGLREELDKLLADSPITATSKVDENGASVDFNGPFGGIRAGICLGLRF